MTTMVQSKLGVDDLTRCYGRTARAMALAWMTIPSAWAADLTINITGIEDPNAAVGCTLFAKAEGFPMDPNVGLQQWLPVAPGTTICRFNGLSEGSYAVAVGIDQNKNRKVDTNLLGIPTEQWGVSNNVRPSLRAPRFEEAAIKVLAGQDVSLQIKVAK